MAGGISRTSMRGGRMRRSMSEINVVPYIDVMLVLLIIFMVAAPLTNPGVIDLPTVSKSSQAKESPITVIVKADKTVTVRDASGQERTTRTGEVASIVEQLSGGDKARPVVISGDKKVEYDAILQVMDGLRQQGRERVGLAVQPRT